MAKGRLQFLKTVPGPRNDAAILAEFCARGDGLVAALDNRHLAALRFGVPSEAEVELLEFGRMAARFARLAGAEPKPMAGTGHVLGAVREACLLAEPDSPFYGSRRFAGLHRRLADTIKELADWGFDPESLANLARECPEFLATKLRSLSQLWTRVEDRLSEFGLELPYCHIERSLQVTEATDVSFPRCILFLDGALTPKHVRWIQWAVQLGADLTVVAQSLAETDGLFHNTHTAESLLGVPATVKGHSDPFVKSLFAGTIAGDSVLKVDRFRAADPLAEVEWAMRRAIESGLTPDQIGMFARNLEEYGPLFESVALRFGVPIRMARSAPLETNGLLRVLRMLLESLCRSDGRSLQWLTNSTYFLFPGELRDEFKRELIEAFRLGPEGWQRLMDWARSKEEALDWFAQILAWRHEFQSSPTTLAVWCERFARLIEAIPAVSKALSGERDLRAKNSFERALAATASFHSNVALSSEDAVAEAVDVIQNHIYVLPSGHNGMVISDSVFGFPDVGHLFVVGMLEGVFPRRRSENPILTDRDREEISGRRALLFPISNSFDEARSERDAFALLCAVPSSGLTFSYPETTGERDNIPAFYLEEAKRALGGEMPHFEFPRAVLAPPLEACRTESDRQLREAIDGSRVRTEPPGDISEGVRDVIRTRSPDSVTIRELRTALECPFRHFAQSRLGLYQGGNRLRWYQLRQLPQASKLLAQATEEEAYRALSSLMEIEIQEIEAHTSEADILMMRQGGERLIRDWMRREFRSRELWTKDPSSLQTDLSFGSPELRDELPRVGKVSGHVAGASRMGPYKVLHMVESSVPASDRKSPFGLKDRDALYYGAHLMAAYEKGAALAVEVESMGGSRKLLLLPRLEEPPILSDVGNGLEVLDLANENEATVAKAAFFEAVKTLLERASKAIKEVDVRPIPGEHCAFCDYGELCRQSPEFGDDFGGNQDG